MQPTTARARRDPRLLVAGAATALAMLAAAPAAHASGNAFVQRNLVSDVPGMARMLDPNLVNPWGLAIGPSTPVWVANNGTSTATLYPGAAGRTPIQPSPFVVQVPHALPTGQVFNDDPNAFMVHSGTSSGPSFFLFASLTGWITGWSPAVPPPPPSTHAQNGRHIRGAAFTGLAIAMHRGHPRLYAADFAQKRVVVLDGRFRVRRVDGAFTDRRIPRSYSPFGIQAIGNRIFVAYAKVDPATGEELAGAGLGFVDVYTTGGRLVHRLVRHTGLDAPWGIAKAPARWGRFGGDILVGNFGNGRIHAYDAMTGMLEGTLRRPSGRPVQIEGLWGIHFGNGVTGDRRELLFAAGIDDEMHGLFGLLRPAM